MHVAIKSVVVIAVLGAAGAGAFYYFQGKSEAVTKPARNPVQIVKTGLAESRAVPITLVANGYVTPIDTVDVRPQVQNVVRAVHVKEGQEVKAGQLLFTLDERSDNSAVEKARAQVARDRADLADAEATLKRNLELLSKNFVSQAVVDTARTKVDAARGTVRANEAALQTTAIALGYNQIRASISGRIGAISVHPGSLVQPSGAPMLTIAQLDPIAVSFAVPERELQYIVTTYPKGNAPVTAQVGGRSHAGRLAFIDNAADSVSGTIRMKAEFPNKERQLWPGSYVNLSMVSRTLADAVVVPAQAVVTGPVDKFVYLVQPDNTVQVQKVEVTVIDEGVAVVSGVAAGTRVVIEGSQNLRPGSEVKEAQAPGAAPSKDKQDRKDKKAAS